MLKISDYIAMMASFIGLMLFYLIFSGSLSIGPKGVEPLEKLTLSADFSDLRETTEAEPMYAVICGNQEESAATKSIIWMLSRFQKNYAVFHFIEDIDSEQEKYIETIIVTARNWEEIRDPELLFEYANKKGKTLIFTDILDEMDDSIYNKEIGVIRSEGKTKIDGFMIGEGILIQGMVYYDDFETSVQNISVDSRCKKYIFELSKEQKEHRELLPILWEKKYGEGAIFAVNASFLKEKSGIGIFGGILSQIEEDFVYPVANIKASLLDHFPEFSNPYEEVVTNLYSRDTNMLLRDIIWPSIVKLAESDNLVISTRIYKEPSKENEQNYRYLSALIEKRGYEVNIGVTDETALLPYVASGNERTDEEIYKMQSYISGSALATHYLDIAEVTGKNGYDEKYEWSSYSLGLSKLTRDLFKDTDWLDTMVVSEGLERYKRYLVMNPDIHKSDNRIDIETKNFDTLCFYMIRTKKEVVPGEGYEAEKVGEDTYLIKVTQEKVSIEVSESERHGY